MKEAGAGNAATFDYSSYLVTLFLSMGLIITGVYVVPAILVEEKEKHTLEAVLVTPASFPDLVAGKALVGIVYSLLSAGIVLLLNHGFSGNPAATLPRSSSARCSWCCAACCSGRSFAR